MFSPKTSHAIMKKTHKAAVKALAWSPQHHGLLVSGAGSADRCLRLWDVNQRKLVNEVDTGS